jgi:hypothetical protein
MYPVSWGSISAALIGLALASAARPYRPDMCIAVGVGMWTPELTGVI